MGHFGEMRFGVIAPETTSVGIAAMGTTVAELVRQRLIVAGFERDTFKVAVGWSEFPHRATTREGLISAAQEALEASKHEGADRGVVKDSPHGAAARAPPAPIRSKRRGIFPRGLFSAPDAGRLRPADGG